jgi:hypothetical protein
MFGLIKGEMKGVGYALCFLIQMKQKQPIVISDDFDPRRSWNDRIANDSIIDNFCDTVNCLAIGFDDFAPGVAQCRWFLF